MSIGSYLDVKYVVEQDCKTKNPDKRWQWSVYFDKSDQPTIQGAAGGIEKAFETAIAESVKVSLPPRKKGA